MDNSTTKRSQATKKSILKPALVSLISLVIVAGVGVATVSLLRHNLVKKIDTIIQAPKVKNAKELLLEFTMPNNVPALSSAEHYDIRYPQGSLLVMKLENKPYSINVQTKDDVLYTAKSLGYPENNSSVLEQVKQFATSNGLQSANSLKADTDNVKYFVFKNNLTTCELTSSVQPVETQQNTTFLFACADNTLAESSYASAEGLLAVYPKTNPAPSFTNLDISTESKGEISYSIIYTKLGAKTAMLLFGTTHGATEYIADLSEGNEQYNNGKYTITPEVRAKISDPKYEGFLLQQLAGIAN